MHRVVGLRTWVILSLLLLSGWGELSAEAQLFRGRRQRCCCPAPSKSCCPARCEPCCCAPRDADAMCVIELLYSSGSAWLYYAHHHENGTECPEFAEVTYPSAVALSPVPMRCNFDECFDPDDAYGGSTTAGLAAPVGAAEDLSGLMATSRSTKLDEVAGNIKLPDDRKIHVRVGLFKIKVPMKVDGVEKEVTEYFGFGFESNDTGRDEIHAQKVTEHLIDSVPQKNLYEFNIGTLKCVVLTVK